MNNEKLKLEFMRRICCIYIGHIFFYCLSDELSCEEANQNILLFLVQETFFLCVFIRSFH